MNRARVEFQLMLNAVDIETQMFLIAVAFAASGAILAIWASRLYVNAVYSTDNVFAFATKAVMVMFMWGLCLVCSVGAISLLKAVFDVAVLEVVG